MSNKYKFLGCILTTVMLTACTISPQYSTRHHHHQTYSKQTTGTLVGAGLGALVGSQFGGGQGRILGAVAGTLVGGYIGNHIGQSMDQADAAYYNRSMSHSLEYNPSGVTSTWKNPDSGNYGRITPEASYISSGRNCREFTQEVFIGGKRQQAFGKACRTSDGSWQIIQ